MTDAPAPTLRLWLTTVAVAAVAMAIGVGVGGGGLYRAGWRPPEQRRFSVSVALRADVTAEQKAAVRARLERIPKASAVRFETPEEAYARVKEASERAQVTEVLKYLDPDAMPASLSVVTTGTGFRCATTDGLRDLPGVGSLTIFMSPTRTRSQMRIAC